MQTTCLFANNRRYLSGSSSPRPLCVVAFPLYQYFVPVNLDDPLERANFQMELNIFTDLDLEANHGDERDTKMKRRR